MKLKQYYEEIKELIEVYPEALEMEVVFSIDSEGNAFNPVNWGPSMGVYDGNGDFIPADSLEDYGYEEEKLNAVCIN